MKKIFIGIAILFAICFSTQNVNAYTYNLTASADTVYVGDNVYVTLSTNDVMGFWQIVSSNENILAGGNGGSIDSGDPFSTTVSFYARNTGTAIISVSPTSAGLNVYSSLEPLGTKTIAINVIARPTYTEPIDVNRTYSANNYLSGLAVEGYELTPAFDKEILEYNLEVDYLVDKVNITASAEDDTATINGVGEVELTEGKNTFNVVVTAENGNERTYVINVLVKELNPINVKVDKNNYSLVKKEDKLPELDNYIKTTIKIGDNEVPALKGKITKYTLVGLKDDKGDIALYIYNAKDKSYTLYNEVKFNNISLYFMENNKNNYKKTTIKINGKEVIAYKKKNLDYYLIYGMNLNTGKVNWYTYDKEEGTIQKYAEGNKVNTIDDNKYQFIVYTLACISGLLTFFMMILFIKYKKKMN